MPRFLPTDGQGKRTTPRASAVVKPGKRKVAAAHSAGAWELDYLAKVKGRGFAWCRTTKTLSGNCAALPQYLPDRPAVKAVLLARTLTEVVLSTPRSKCQPEPEQWAVSARPSRMAATCAGTPLGASRMTFAAGSWRSGAPDTRPEPIRVVPRARVLPDVSLGTCGPHHRAVITRGNWRAVES